MAIFVKRSLTKWANGGANRRQWSIRGQWPVVRGRRSAAVVSDQRSV